MRFPAIILYALALSPTLIVHADEARLKCTADTSVSSYESEQDFNYGQRSALRIKGIEMLALFKFDTKPAANWEIKKATLYLRYAGSDHKLRTIGISTISAPWQEGTGAGEKKDGEACFGWQAYGQTRWAGADTDFTDVSFSAGCTIVGYSDAKEIGSGWIAVPVEPKLVQALIAGASYGLAVSDEKGQTFANNDVYSREQSGSEPYLLVEGAVGPSAAPHAVEAPTASPDIHDANFSTGTLKLAWTSPPGSFAYDVRYCVLGGETPRTAARSVIPFARPGARQTAVLNGLKPEAIEEVEITPISATGVRGPVARLQAAASAAVLRPDALLKPASFTPHPALAPIPAGALRVWAYPDTEKADPISGNLLEEVGAEHYSGAPMGEYRRANAVWDGRAVHLLAARKEIVAFQLLVESATGNLGKVVVKAPGTFRSAASNPPWTTQLSLYRDWYVRDGSWFPEACIPLTGPFDVPAPDNAVPSQRNQSVFIELLVPDGVAPGLYRSEITVSADHAAPVHIPLEMRVNSLTLPNRLSFDVSLNTYGTFGGPFNLDDRTAAYRALELDYHRMAHLHRTTLEVLGYSHTGHITDNYAPPLAGKGVDLHVTDWSDWDAQFGPYFDGSAFADLPRKGEPITHFYLPFHEAWPVDIRSHYSYQQTVTDYPAMIVEHAMRALPVEQAMDQEIADGFTAIARQFVDHFRAKGWTHTEFQFYQNDKYFYKDPKMDGRGTSWWLLDEPAHRDDWLALAYFARLYRKGISGIPGVSMIYREDVSRPQWQRDYLDGQVDLMAVSGELYNKGPRLREMQEQWGVKYWNYGTANAVRRSNTETEGWAVRAWLAGADCIVPWQSLGTDDSFIHPDETGLILPGKRFGIQGPVASLRLKALRRAQQDVEYLVQIAAARRWSRAQVAAALRDVLNMKGEINKTSDADAGSYRFDTLHAADFENLCHAVADSIGRP